MEVYPFAVEISAALGMFPSLECETRSCHFPPESAAAGIIESICWSKGVEINMLGVAFCSAPKFQPYHVEKKIYQVLVEPRFILVGQYRSEVGAGRLCQRELSRRLRQEKIFTFMGWKDFPLSYCGKPITPIFPHQTAEIKNGIFCYQQSFNIFNRQWKVALDEPGADWELKKFLSYHRPNRGGKGSRKRRDSLRESKRVSPSRND